MSTTKDYAEGLIESYLRDNGPVEDGDACDGSVMDVAEIGPVLAAKMSGAEKARWLAIVSALNELAEMANEITDEAMKR